MRSIISFETIIIVKYTHGVLKVNAMLFQIQRGLLLVPLELHRQFPLVLYNNIIIEMPAFRKA